MSSMPGPPIGLQLSSAARVLGRAFDDALDEAGGSLPVWLVLLNLKIRAVGSQRELAEAIGITEATLTHHLNAMDAAGLLTRRRDHTNRRIHVIELTADGEEAFLRLRDAAVAYDQRLRTGLSDAEIAQLGGLLRRLVANVGGTPATSAYAGPGQPAAEGAQEGGPTRGSGPSTMQTKHRQEHQP